MLEGGYLYQLPVDRRSKNAQKWASVPVLLRWTYPFQDSGVVRCEDPRPHAWSMCAACVPHAWSMRAQGHTGTEARSAHAPGMRPGILTRYLVLLEEVCDAVRVRVQAHPALHRERTSFL